MTVVAGLAAVRKAGWLRRVSARKCVFTLAALGALRRLNAACAADLLRADEPKIGRLARKLAGGPLVLRALRRAGVANRHNLVMEQLVVMLELLILMPLRVHLSAWRRDVSKAAGREGVRKQVPLPGFARGAACAAQQCPVG